MKSKSGSSGNVIFALFAAIGIVGALGATINSYVIGPLKSASNVNNRGAVEAQMDTSVRVAMKNASLKQALGGDCDGDGTAEPIPYDAGGGASVPVGGGLLPVTIAGSLRDPWGNRYGYCTWDHGSSVDAAGCGGAGQARQRGTNATSWPVIALISAGPNRVFETTCNDWVDANANLQPDTPLVQRAAITDDIQKTWSYDEASGDCGGLCTLQTWTSRTAAEANSWQSVTYGNGLFVAVSSDGANRVMTSPDGITWTARTAAEANSWKAVTYGNGQFVAVSSDGTNRVMTSPDGITWTARAHVGVNPTWTSVFHGNGMYVAVGNNNSPRIMSSPDGITWTSRAGGANNTDVIYANGLFVVVIANGTDRVLTSPDGITWTARTASEANSWKAVTYGEGLFVAVSTNGTNRVMTSPDGVTWTARTAAEANAWGEITYGNGHFVAVSSDGTNRVMTSTDGITWASRPAAQANQWTSVAYGNGTFVAVSSDGTNRVMTSSCPTCSDDLWALEGGDQTTAEIDKIISVKDGSAVEQLSFNPTSVVLSLPDSSASGHFPTLRTNSIDRYNTTITNALDPVSILPEDGSGNEYYFRNPTGDALEMYQGTIASSVPKMGMSQSGLRVDYYMGDLNKYMRTRINGSTGTGLRLSSNANTSGYINGVEFLNTGYINGYSIFQTLRTTGGADPVLSAIYFHSMLAPVASSTVPTVTGLYGDLRFLTRPLGQAATDETALVERMRIRHDGRIQIGIVSDRSFHVEGGNTIVSGRVGINTDTPAAELHNFGREMTLRNGGESCVAAIEGAIRGNTTTQCIETCDGVAWKCMGVPTCANTAPTIASPFINNVNTAASTQYTSNIISVTNTSCNNQFKVWGDGTPQYRLCTDATCSTNPAWQTATFDWPSNAVYYIQLRNTSPAAVGTKRTTYIRLGDTYQSWTLSVQAACGSYATPIGTICADGTMYVGPSIDGYGMMYSTVCSAGKTWSGTACTGGGTTMRWSNTGTINHCSNTSAPANSYNGRANTTYLAALSNVDSPYTAAQYCENLVQNGYSDWYLPAALELQNINVAARNGMLPSLYLTDPEITSGTWSSTAGDNPANSQCLNMSWTYNSNGVQARTRVTSYYVMCVRR